VVKLGRLGILSFRRDDIVLQPAAEAAFVSVHPMVQEA
jgi:hypothetical protein